LNGPRTASWFSPGADRRDFADERETLLLAVELAVGERRAQPQDVSVAAALDCREAVRVQTAL
jgi:hypothetical protein